MSIEDQKHAGECLNCAYQATTPCGRSRREFLWEMGGGFVATALTTLLAEGGFVTSPAGASPSPALNPLAPKRPHYQSKAKSVIFLFMYGGPSQIDTWDPKPELVKRTGQPMPNLDYDPLFKMRHPGTLLGSTHQFVPLAPGQEKSPTEPIKRTMPSVRRTAIPSPKP